MGTLFKEKIFLFLHLALIILFMSMSLSNIVFAKLFSDYVVLEIVTICLMASPVFLFKKNIFSIIYSLIIFTYFCIAYVISLMLDYNTGDIFSLKYINLAKELLQVSTPSFFNVFYILFLIFFIVSYLSSLIYFILLSRKNKNKKKPTSYCYILAMFVFIISIGMPVKYLAYNDIENANKESELYKDMKAPEIINFASNRYKKSAFERYGLVSYYFNELTEMVSFNTPEKKKIIDDYLNDNPKALTNDYTAKFKDMNVLTIMVESAQSYAVDEVLTPNLYELQTKGLKFNNNLSKNKTNISEIIGMLGSTYEHTISSGYNVDFSLPAMLNKAGYETAYFHDNYGGFYDRDNVMKEMGFKNRYFHNYYSNSKIEFKGNMSFDTTFVEKVGDKMVPKNKKFYSYWTTIATHGPYYSNMDSVKKYEELGYYNKLNALKEAGKWVNPIDRNFPKYKNFDIKEEDKNLLRNQFEHYQVEMMNFDEALGMLIDKLKQNGQYDNTIIVLYGDHDSYYASSGLRPIKYYLYGCMDKEEFPLQYETFLCISNPKLNSLYNEKNGNTNVDILTSPYIIVPTILDLLGLDYNKNYYVSNSLFNSKGLDNVFYSCELKSVFSNKVFDIDYKNTKYKSDGLDDVYLNEFYNQELKLIKKINIFNMMYKYQYFGSK